MHIKPDSTGLETAIKAAFATAPYPGDDSLFNPRVKGDHDDVNEVATVLVGSRWDELTAELVVRAGTELFFLPVKALAYYLPGYMLLMLHEEDRLGLIPMPLIMVLSARLRGVRNSKRWARLQKLLAHLTSEQRCVVVAFLRHMVDTYDALDWSVDRELAEFTLADWVEALAADAGPST